MARPSDRRRQAARDHGRRSREARAGRRRRRLQLVAVAVAGLVVLGTVGALVAGGRSSPDPAATTTTGATLPATGPEPAPVPAGEALTGPTPCPAEDGSSPRVTAFDEAPPTCIDLATYQLATLTTAVGDLVVRLDPRLAPEVVNAFVVLARYHFYDGQPVTSILPRAAFTVGVALDGANAEGSPGFAFPGPAATSSTVLSPGAFGLAGAASSSERGWPQLVIGTLEQAGAVDSAVTVIGSVVDGADVLGAVDTLATADGRPAGPVAVTSVTVGPGGPIAP